MRIRNSRLGNTIEAKKKVNLIAMGVIGVLVFGILVAEVVGLIAAFTNEGTSKNVLRVLWMGIGLFATLLLSGGFFLLWILRVRLNRKYRWAMSLFGTEDVGILDENAFALKAGKRLLALRKKDGKHAFFRHKTAFVVSMGVRSVRGIDATVSSSSLHAMNLAICECLEQAYGRSDILFGASERGHFLLYIEIEEDQAASMKEALTRFADETVETFDARGDLPPIAVLFGAAEANFPRDDIESTMAHADFALAHNAGNRLSGDFQVYDAQMVKEEAGRRSLDEEVSRAIENEEFQIYYQAKWDVKNARFYGAEALIRWKHPTRGVLPPTSFIPYCESSSKIVEIDHYVFDRVCRDLAEWNQEGKRKVVVSVNLSRRTVYDPNLLPFLEETLAKYRVSPSQFEIELTESLAAQNVVFISAIIRRIKALGFGTSMDDFGIGYSSLSSLKNIPFSVLKIDKSFIDDIEIDNKSRSMVRSIIELVHALGMKTIAEGVETADQVRILQSLGLDAIQGFYFSRPLERARFEAFLESNIFEPQSHSERKVQPHDPTRR